MPTAIKTAIILGHDYGLVQNGKEERRSWKSRLFIFNGKNITTTKEGHPIDIGTAGENFTIEEWIGQN